MVQFVNSRCSSLMLNHHSITKQIISLTLTLLQCYYFNTLSVDYIYTGSVDLTLEVLLCEFVPVTADADVISGDSADEKDDVVWCSFLSETQNSSVSN